jgi:DNA-binding transcriptional MerR regulator
MSTISQQVTPPEDAHAGDELLTIAEVADVLRVPIATLRYWRHLGTGPRSFRLGRRVVYRVADLRAWIDAQAGASDAGTAVSPNG